MPRFWAEAYRIDLMRVGVRIFRASWLRPWRATHVMEVTGVAPESSEVRSAVWKCSDGRSLHTVSAWADIAADMAVRRLMKKERKGSNLWIPIVPQPRMRLRSGGTHCLGPEVCGLETDHVLGCPMGQLGTAGMGPG